MLYVLLVIVLVVLMGIAKIWTVLRVMMEAADDLYALLSFENLHLSEVVTRVEKSKSEHLKRYLSSKIFQSTVREKLKNEVGEDIHPEQQTEEMLLYLLGSMQETGEVVLTSDICTLDWLEANKHRLFMLPPDELEDMFRCAREADAAPEHTNEPDCVHMGKVLLFNAWYEGHPTGFKDVSLDEALHWSRVALEIKKAPEADTVPKCERCKKIQELDVATFVRKLPQGRRRKRRVPLKKLRPAFLHS